MLKNFNKGGSSFNVQGKNAKDMHENGTDKEHPVGSVEEF